MRVRSSAVAPEDGDGVKGASTGEEETVSWSADMFVEAAGASPSVSDRFFKL